MCCEITSLQHEIGYDPMEATPLIPVSLFPSTKSPKIISSLRYNIIPQIKGDPSSRLPIDLNVEKSVHNGYQYLLKNLILDIFLFMVFTLILIMQDVTIFNSPKLAIVTFVRVLARNMHFIGRMALKILPVVVFYMGLYFLANRENPFQEHARFYLAILHFGGYWLALGIASSIGLGTGLHTFVLYLGPHIAEVAMVAYDCGKVPSMLPNRWQFQYFQACENTAGSYPNFWTVVSHVQLEAFLWGLGTAIGQLPPYFVAFAHSKSGENDQLDQLQNLKKNQSNLTIIQRLKIGIMDQLQKHGFITIVLLSSIPNPLFDLAGLLCGHFQFSFTKFFTATMIGKALIKVNIQVFFIVLIFGNHFSTILQNIISAWPTLGTTLSQLISQQKQNLYQPKLNHERGLLSIFWEALIMLMIGYFITSLLNSLLRKFVAEEEKSK